jgi:predicted dehydrogenase
VTEKASGLRELRIGIIGCGAVAETCHLPAAKKLIDVRVKALADISREQAEVIADRFHLTDVSIYTNHLTMLADSDIDAVWILTPPKLHATMILDSLSHAKHVLCEKPLATSVEETEKIRKTLKKMEHASNYPVLMPAHNFIFTPCFQYATNLIENGEIGNVKRIRAYAASNLSFYNAKTDFRKLARGGVIEDQLPHAVYLSQDVGGPCARVISVKPRREGRTIVEDVDVEAELQKGVYAEFSAAWTGLLPTLMFDVVGESGKISMDLLRRPYNVTVVKDEEKEQIRMGRQLLQYWDVLRGNHPSYLNEHKHFAELVSGEAKPRVTVENGVQLVKTIGSVLSFLDREPLPTARKETVSVVRVESDVKAAVKKAVLLQGGLGIRRDARVVVKPNVCSKKNTGGMVITDPRVLGGVGQQLGQRRRAGEEDRHIGYNRGVWSRVRESEQR